jgi:hypothetical protein
MCTISGHYFRARHVRNNGFLKTLVATTVIALSIPHEKGCTLVLEHIKG